MYLVRLPSQITEHRQVAFLAIKEEICDDQSMRLGANYHSKDGLYLEDKD